MTDPRLVEPKDATYPHVPTPKELELSRQVVDLQQEKDVIESKLMAQIHDLESQIHKLQVRIHDLSQQLQANKREQVISEQAAIENERGVWRTKVEALQQELDAEKNDKEAQKRWRIKFLIGQDVEGEIPQQQDAAIDPVEDALAKFAQSIALLPASAAPKATKAGVLPFLVHLLRENFSDVVTGSVLMALIHLAIYQRPRRVNRYHLATAQDAEGVNVKDEIGKAGVAAPLARILEVGNNPRVLTEACRLCAALGGFVPNKRILAAKNTVRFVIRLLLPSASFGQESPETDDDPAHTSRSERFPLPGTAELQRAALSALVNLAHDSEVLRSQIVNFHFIPVAVRYLRESADVAVQAEAAKLLGNLAFNHVVNQSAIMTAEGDAFLAKRLAPENVHKCADLVRACAIGVGNLGFTSVNQLSIGYGDAMTFLLQILVDSTNPLVLDAAAAAISGLCHLSPLNKGRLLAQNGIQVLLYVIGRSQRYNHDEEVLITALECFSIVAQPRAARNQVMELDGHLPLCQLCKKSKSESLLRSSAMALCTLIPTPLDRQILLADGKPSKLETNGIGLSSLERVKHLVYGRDGDQAAAATPAWLVNGIARLREYAAQMNAVADAMGPAEEETNEYHERSYYSLESLTEIQPDELCPHFYEG